MSPDQLQRATGCTAENAARFAPGLTQATERFEINTRYRTASFLANIAHESGRFAVLTENLNYSVDALIRVFGRHRISEADARAFGRIDDPRTKKVVRPANQQAIANAIYGCPWAVKALGNTQPGDGWKFRGQGLIQSTGRSNAVAARDELRRLLPGEKVPDFAQNPEALIDPYWSSMQAGLFWWRNGINKSADACNFDAACDAVNLGKITPTYGDSNGFADRKALYERALGVF